MSTCRIALDFDEFVHPRFAAHGHQLRILRVVARLRFLTPTGWTARLRPILDTGTPVTLIPRTIWQGIRHHLVSAPATTIRVSGVVAEAHLAEVECRIMDAQTVSPHLKMHAYLCDTDDIPVLLGFDGLLTRATFVCDYPTHTAYLEFP